MWWLAVWVLASARLLAADPEQIELEGRFSNTIRPFFETYCIDCHSGEKPKADLDLRPYSTLGEVVRAPLHWELVLEKLQSAEMPPETIFTLALRRTLASSSSCHWSMRK